MRQFRPIFVFGVARSGTNLIARMLERHSRVAVALDPLMPVFRALRNAVTAALPATARTSFRPDLPFQDHYFSAEGAGLLDALLEGSAALPVSAPELEALRRAVCERTALESPALSGCMARLDGDTYRALIESALEIIAESKSGALWVGFKEVWVLDFVPLLSNAFPHARFYAIERDPRAVVASLLAMGETDRSQRAHPPSYMRHWRKNVALARRFASAPSLGGRFRALSEELGIEQEPGMLNLSAEGWAGNSSYQHADRDVYGSSAQRWRGSLPPEVVRAADFLCGPEMALTEYRVESRGGPEAVLAYLKRAADDAGSWRSDSGDVDLDFAGELQRHALLEAREADAPAALRRCFLFPETFEAIRAARRRAA
jgi:Sulfotransferase family